MVTEKVRLNLLLCLSIMYGFYNNSKLKQQMRFFVTVNQMFSGSYCWAHGSDNETVLGSCQKLGGAVNI